MANPQQRAWLREFYALGLQLRPQAAKAVTEFLQGCEEPLQMAESMVEATKRYLASKHGAMNSIIDVDVITKVLDCMTESSRGQEAAKGIDTLDLGDGVHVYDATLDVRPFEFRRATKEWVPSSTGASIFAGCESKAKIYHERYHLLLQRMLLEGKYVLEEEVAANGLMPGQRVLTKVESLKGNPGNKVVLGLLSRSQGGGNEGRTRTDADENDKHEWVIEDPHASFRVEIVEKETDHMMTDGSFVLAQGSMQGAGIDVVFRIHQLDVPEAVPRRLTLEKDLVPRQVFGGNLSDEQLVTLQQSEHLNPDGFYVTLCEVHLDSAKVLDRLKDLFQGYEQCGPPTAYVFMGSFCSTAFVPTGASIAAYKDGFERLSHLMRPLAKHVSRGTRFIFIPGPKDPGVQMLPRVPLPAYLTANLAKEVPNVIFATNPCRIHHMSRELVFFRHDVLRLLRRNEVLPLKEPDTGDDASLQHARFEMMRFLMDQAHLVPLPLESTNVLWSYDHVLRLYPLPDAIFIGGISQQFDKTYQECKFASVGPFNRTGEFYAFHPIREGPDAMEPCDVPEREG